MNQTTSQETYPIKVPGCDPCTLGKFLELAEARRPSNWYAECGLRDPDAVVTQTSTGRMFIAKPGLIVEHIFFIFSYFGRFGRSRRCIFRHVPFRFSFAP